MKASRQTSLPELPTRFLTGRPSQKFEGVLRNALSSPGSVIINIPIFSSDNDIIYRFL
jgi:hypothetical protein